MEKIKMIRYNCLSLYGKTKEDGRARLLWGIRDKYPRIIVYTSDKAFNDGKPNYDYIITAPFDTVTLNYLVGVLELCNNNSKLLNSIKVDCLNTRIVNGERTKEKYTQATVEIGRDENGIIYITVSEENKGRHKFELLPNLVWFKYKTLENEEINDKALLSKIFTRGYINSIKTLLLEDRDNYNMTLVMLDPPINKKSEMTTLKKEEPVEVKEDNIKETPVLEPDIINDDLKLEDKANNTMGDDELEDILNG